MADSDKVRAGVFIGVDKSGDLAKLNVAAEGARRMHAWALSQGMRDGTHAKLITDAAGKVSPDQVYDAIEQIVDGAGVDQLIVYFAGHGVNINRNEHWLLTDAPRRSSAAINVSGSAELARYCGIRHVVFMSDACRAAPEGIQAQNVRGQDIFPNDGPGETMMPVDQFFACELGRTAVEIRDPAEAATTYRAIYTDAVLDAISGFRAEVLDPASDPVDKARYVHPSRLKAYLNAEIPARIRELGEQYHVNQRPDALVMADSPWIARIPLDGRVPTRTITLDPTPGHLARVTSLSVVDSQGPMVAGMVARVAERARAPLAEQQFDSRCGIRVRGTTIEDFLTVAASGTLGFTRRSLALEPEGTTGFSVLLKFANGLGTVLPALPGFATTITVDDGEITDVAFEPSPGTARRRAYPTDTMRYLRAVAALSSRHGRFKLDRDTTASFVRQIRYADTVDLALAVYAAYALHEYQHIDTIRELDRSLFDGSLFDVALLSRDLTGKVVGRDTGVLPFVPMLSRGWALLSASRVRLHPALDGVDRTMRESVWSLFDTTGVDMLAEALRSGDVR